MGRKSKAFEPPVELRSAQVLKTGFESFLKSTLHLKGPSDKNWEVARCHMHTWLSLRRSLFPLHLCAKLSRKKIV